ncbi:up-regulator of cell proliferation-like [Leptodactylus fuscus]|uniref:up-regulator of cell proliferation-like n=1 Tax=Leptodactylus fuscus TaxID=238119 RepID=UPI003F4EA908
MAFLGKASKTIDLLRPTFIETFEENVEGFVDEMDSLQFLTSEDLTDLQKTEDPREMTHDLINLILHKGEKACEKFLDHLENMIPRFPGLNNLKHNLFSKRRQTLLKMLNYHETSKLTIRNVLDIGPDHLNTIDPLTLEEIPMTFLKKIMKLNSTARNTQAMQKDYCDDPQENLYVDLYTDCELEDPDALHPSDVLCLLLHCSDSFLQQEIITKMSMCQFAVPLLLPDSSGPSCTYMLWAMRDIVKKWRPQALADSKGFKEDRLVNISMPIFSFVRLGRPKMSKSKILNEILNTTNQHNAFFVHGEMECGNIDREISDGLVEAAWYFPTGSKSSDIFPEPITVINLCGDLQTNWAQFSFLSQISTAVFAFTEGLDEEQFNQLSRCSTKETKFYFIIDATNQCYRDSEKFLKMLFPVLNIDQKNIIPKTATDNNARLVSKIRYAMKNCLEKYPRKENLESISEIACEFGFKVDEICEECSMAKQLALEITSEISEVVEYKKETLKLQGDLWKRLTVLEKELCRMKQQGLEDLENYKTRLTEERHDLLKKQNEHKLPEGMIKFISAVTTLSQRGRWYFLKWLKYELDPIARKNLSDLQAKYEEICLSLSSDNLKELKQLDKKLCDSTLGTEHFLRELGQLYGAECFMLKNEKINQGKFSNLPGIAAELFLDGFPLELIDGEASNIPLQWITDVLTELDKKTGGQCRMRVITVLGVQSTGKSTLLNTMFGLQFPVASGRCTRGAFMTLIRVKENFQEELGCEFILVIDTEGLKAPELASLDDSYEHDNELATLVVGLSDITIVNMSMENTAEMKDILQIVVHAFLRMKDVGKKPNCHFVHQNVSDVSAHAMNTRDRKQFLEQLNEITELAAKMEKKRKVIFSDIMVYDLKEHSWYIPGLWQGVHPMVTVNSGYSEMVNNLKTYLLNYIREHKLDHNARHIWEFLEWINTLWSAVKHENFIFSFRNSLVAEAYNKLCIGYSQWDWQFRKQVHDWLIKTETTIKNIPLDKMNDEIRMAFKKDLEIVVQKGERVMQEMLQKYYDSKSANVHLLERYRENFYLDVKCLSRDLKNYACKKLDDAIRIQEGKYEIQNIQGTYQKMLEEKVTSLLEKCRKEKSPLKNESLMEEFELMWNASSSEFSRYKMSKRNINQEMLQQLMQDMDTKGGFIKEQLLSIEALRDYKGNDFKMNEKYFEVWDLGQDSKEMLKHECYHGVQDLAISLMQRCSEFVEEKISKKEDYDKTYTWELLNIIKRSLTDSGVTKLHVTLDFELDIKLKIMGNSVESFQTMHDQFLQENDPFLCLEKLKPHYFLIFTNIFQQKDESQHRAKEFCELGLKPALNECIYQHLGTEIVNHFLNGDNAKLYGSRSFFQYSVLKKLLLEKDFGKYVKYINSYEQFVKTWIYEDLQTKYGGSKDLEDLHQNILSSIIKKTGHALNNPESLQSENIESFLNTICQMLENDLVIPQSVTRMIVFHNKADICQFSKDVEMFLVDTKEQIKEEFKSLSFDVVLSRVALKPQNELFKKVFGCGKKCPFCKVPCEAAGGEHKEHFASVHRPKGLAKCSWKIGGGLVTSTCSLDVNSDRLFENTDTDGEQQPYREYRTIYPDWNIQPDVNDSCHYWKYVFREFNRKFADAYTAEVAQFSEDWKHVTEEDALRSLQQQYNVNEE